MYIGLLQWSTFFHCCYCDMNHNPQVNYCNHKNLQPVPIMNQINLINDLQSTCCRSILVSPTNYVWLSPPRYCMHLSTSPYVLHASPISFFLMWWPKYLLSTDHKMSHFPHSHITKSIVGPNIFLSPPFPNTHSLCSSLNVEDQLSHPCKAKGKIIVLYILTFIFLESKPED